jgi:hypothetical protein
MGTHSKSVREDLLFLAEAIPKSSVILVTQTLTRTPSFFRLLISVVAEKEEGTGFHSLFGGSDGRQFAWV